MGAQITALAVGGLGGFNAHDAGVLKAAHDSGMQPDVISCTSGGMYWVHQYLSDPDGLESLVERQASRMLGETGPTTLLTGVAGICAPAVDKYWMRWWQPWKGPSFRETLNRVLPAQVLEFKIPPEELQEMVDVFNWSDVPVLFNAFAIAQGHELVFCNDAAFEFLKVTQSQQREHLILGAEVTTEYLPIDAAAIRSALWVVLYGFENYYRGEVVIDGAYHRQIILSELRDCDLIYVVKPQCNAWHGSPPENHMEIQDFNTEMWFNASFAGEVGCLQSQSDGEPPVLELITMERPLGFLNYFTERMRNYWEGYDKGRAAFGREVILPDRGAHIDLRQMPSPAPATEPASP